MGSHHGETRIIRHALGEGKAYTPLALRSQQLWEELQQISGYDLFRQTGVLSFGPKGAPFIQKTISSADEYGIPYQRLSHEDIQKRWPGIEAPSGYEGCLEEQAGMLYSATCVRAFREMALQAGAELLVNTPVTNISPDQSTVYTPDGNYTASQIIVSGGAWNEHLFNDLGLDVSLQPTRQTNVWFDADEELFSIDHPFPIFFADLPDGEYYGFPAIDNKGVKSGRHDDGPNVNPSSMDRTFGAYREDEQAPRQFLERFLPKAAGALVDGRACIYTRTPDNDFIIDRHPKHPHLLLAGGFSGHGFKYAPVVGEILSELIIDGLTTHNIAPFSIERESLKN